MDEWDFFGYFAEVISEKARRGEILVAKASKISIQLQTKQRTQIFRIEWMNGIFFVDASPKLF